MQSFLWAVILCLCMHETVLSQPMDGDDRTLLQNLLIQSKEQNRKLEQQMKRMKMMWSGFQQMCSALDMSQCDCKMENKPDLPDRPLFPKEKGAVVNATLLMVTSAGVEDDGSVELKIVYKSGDDHMINLMVPYYNNKYGIDDFLRPDVEKVEQDINEYHATARIPNVLDARDIYLRILSGKRGISALIDVNVARNNTQQTIPEFTSSVVRLNYTQMAPDDDNLTVSIVIQEDSRDLFILTYSNVEFNGLNTEMTPPRMFEIGSYIGDDIKMTGNMNTEATSWFNITISSKFAKFGGLMTVLLPLSSYREKVLSEDHITINTDLIKKMYEVHIIEVLLSDSKKVVADNSVGFYPFDSELKVFQEKGSVSCMTMGSPPPLLSLHRNVAGGREKKVEGFIFSVGPYLKLLSYTVEKDDLKSPKTFTCRAKSGSAVAEQTVEAKALIMTPVTFDMAKTGVMKNTTEKIVFGCKASWKTNPKLTIHLYDSSGPIISDNDDFQVNEKLIGRKTSKITVTVTPRNDAIHTVYCKVGVPWREGKLIELFPDMSPEWDWDLYNNLLGPLQNRTVIFDMY